MKKYFIATPVLMIAIFDYLLIKATGWYRRRRKDEE